MTELITLEPEALTMSPELPGRFGKYPKELHIGVTDWCNLKCFICMREEYEDNIGGPGIFMSLEKIKKLETAIREAEIVNLTGFGETFLHPNFDDIIEYILSVNQRPNLIKIITNGTALTKKRAKVLKGKISSLIVSLNAARAIDYEREMGSKWSVITNRLRQFISILDEEDRRRIELHHVTHAFNYLRMSEFVEVCHNLGLYQVNFNPFMVQRRDNIAYSLMYVREEYNIELAKARMLGRELDVKVIGRKFFDEKRATGNMEDLCVWPFEQAQIGTYGEFMPCCFSGHENMGNVFKEGFESIWFSEPYEKLRKNRYLKSCQNCAQLTIFDDYRTHFHPELKLTPGWEKIEGDLDTQEHSLINRRSIFKTLGLDPELYRYASDALGGEPMETELLQSLGQGNNAYKDISKIVNGLNTYLESSFKISKLPEINNIEISADDLFLGSGWGSVRTHTDFGMQSRVAGLSRSPSLYFNLTGGNSYRLQTYIWYETSLETLQGMVVKANGAELEYFFDKALNLLRHSCVIPAAVVDELFGRVKITYQLPEPDTKVSLDFQDFAFVKIECAPEIYPSSGDEYSTGDVKPNTHNAITLS